MDVNISVRLKAFIAYLNITDSAFADNCGITRSTLSLILSGNTKKVSDQQIAQIHERYPELSILWLLFGEGTMLVVRPGEESTEKSDFRESEKLELLTDDESEQKEPVLSALNLSEKELRKLSESQLALVEKIHNLESKILKLESEPRKVRKITIFYDDSTFESFVPEK